MDIYVYSDESGVFDKQHNEWYVFGGLIFLGKESRDIASRMYSKAEKDIRTRRRFDASVELKASSLHNSDKGKLYRSLNNFHKFGAIVYQKGVLNRIFLSSKDKQRYLDYVYKIAVKRCLEKLINCKVIAPENIDNIFFYVDEHSTATNGLYELREALEQELKRGTYNMNYSLFYPPILPSMKAIHLTYRDSKSTILIRASDIVANRLRYLSVSGKPILSNDFFGPHITMFP